MAVHLPLGDLVQQAEALFHRGEFTAAARLLSDGISESPSALLWNDWAAVQVSLGQLRDAERGFRTALQIDPTSVQAMENLGALLFARGCHAEAAAYLKMVLPLAAQEKRSLIEKMLVKCAETALPVDSTASPANQSNAAAAASAALLPDPSLVCSVDPSLSYDEWCGHVFRQQIPTPGVRIATSWPEDSDWGKRAFNALIRVECEYVTSLLTEIRDRQIEGEIAEFGIFQGWWINFLHHTTEQLGLQRRVYGFDSFEGLSEPHPENDLAFWKKGQYACSLEQVSRNVQAAARPRIRLIKGFFERSLRGAEAQVVEKFSYVRIDCDIYEPALDCLRYLGPRLADGAILVFDDWPHLRGYGEQRAFEEWLPSVPRLEFEFLFYGVIGHFYLRVHRKK
ncbi:MAG TPA: TylF/MycF/NovP-related O-methyltransferase [Candidatus Eisenbacteria bacterium]|nr:TylF/MycF/NovP-related O-methyltransferase [Candidatus Eisenbacteria bacterium]